jgi:hypothetical protein
MSLPTWKKEFYRSKFPNGPIRSVEHSLRKWKGLQRNNLLRHECLPVVLDPDARPPIYEGIADAKWISSPHGTEERHVLCIDATTCALCFHYLKGVVGEPEDCNLCPLQQTLGRSCDRPGEPFSDWVLRADPMPMIRALEITLKRLKKKETPA